MKNTCHMFTTLASAYFLPLFAAKNLMDKEADFSSQLKHARIYTQKHTHARNIDMFATTPSVSCAFTARDSRRASSQSAASSRCSSSSCSSRSGFPFPILKVFSFGTRGMRRNKSVITSIREGGAHHHSFSRRREKKSIIISKRRRQRENGLLFCPKAEADKEGEKEQPKRLSKKEAEEAARAALMGAIGNKKDKLKAFDNGGRGGGFFNFGGGGGGGSGGDGSNKGTLQVLFLLFCVVFVFYGLKPVSAMFVNLIYYAFKIPTGRPGDEEPEDALSYASGKAGQSADADVISKYGGDDDDDDDDDDDE